MGIFDFVRNAGAKVGIGDGADGNAEETVAAEGGSILDIAKKVKEAKGKSDAMAASFDESKKAAGIEAYVKGLGLEIDDLDIRCDDGVATITGTAKNQASREKVILAVGNIADVGQVQDDIKVSDGSSESGMHVVVSGDTLGKIAKEYYDDASKYPIIFDANKPMLKDPDKIFVGQVLRIPVVV